MINLLSALIQLIHVNGSFYLHSLSICLTISISLENQKRNHVQSSNCFHIKPSRIHEPGSMQPQSVCTNTHTDKLQAASCEFEARTGGTRGGLSRRCHLGKFPMILARICLIGINELCMVGLNLVLLIVFNTFTASEEEKKEKENTLVSKLESRVEKTR